MANTMTLISSVTVGADGASSIDFTSIPSTYTDLLLKVSVRSNNASVLDTLGINFNGSSANYTMRNLLNEGGTPASYTQTAYASQNATGYQSGATATASTFGNTELYFPNYAGSNNKSVSVDSVSENNASAGWLWLGADLWSQTAAINRITLLCAGGTNSFVQYSTAYLYGIKNS